MEIQLDFSKKARIQMRWYANIVIIALAAVHCSLSRHTTIDCSELTLYLRSVYFQIERKKNAFGTFNCNKFLSDTGHWTLKNTRPLQIQFQRTI